MKVTKSQLKQIIQEEFEQIDEIVGRWKKQKYFFARPENWKGRVISRILPAGKPYLNRLNWLSTLASRIIDEAGHEENIVDWAQTLAQQLGKISAQKVTKKDFENLLLRVINNAGEGLANAGDEAIGHTQYKKEWEKIGGEGNVDIAGDAAEKTAGREAQQSHQNRLQAYIEAFVEYSGLRFEAVRIGLEKSIRPGQEPPDYDWMVKRKWKVESDDKRPLGGLKKDYVKSLMSEEKRFQVEKIIQEELENILNQ
jgi:hypothetical protein